MSRRAFPIQPNHGKPVVRVELESAARLVQIMIRNSGEAELERIRLTDDRTVNKHYDLNSGTISTRSSTSLPGSSSRTAHPTPSSSTRPDPGATRRHGTTGVIRRRRTDRDANPERGIDRAAAASAADPPCMR
jgi:hypothetical protein